MTDDTTQTHTDSEPGTGPDLTGDPRTPEHMPPPPEVVVDPQSGKATQEYIRAMARKGLLHHAEPGETKTRPFRWMPVLTTRLLLPTGACAGLSWIFGAMAEHPAPEPGTRSLNDVMRHHFVELCEGLETVAALGAALAALHGTVRVFGILSAHEQYRSAQGHFVLAADLDDTARRLLARAQTAVDAVRATRIHAHDLLDRQRNDVLLPAQLWSIACDLAAYSRLSGQHPDEPRTHSLTEIVSSRAGDLERVRRGIDRRVAALEAYAVHARQSDALYQEWCEARDLADGHAEVTDLLARTAAEDLDIAETAGMTGKAGEVGAAFRTALDETRTAAAAALPSHGDH
ncbi:hypothetical protein [Streptomyces sp. NPDC001889]